MVSASQTAIAVEPDDDLYIPIDAAPRLIPGRPHRATIWRWTLRGIKRGGQTVRLKSIAAGGRRFTTRAWIEEFLCACNADFAAPTPESTARPSRQRAEAAGVLLTTMGVK